MNTCHVRKQILHEIIMLCLQISLQICEIQSKLIHILIVRQKGKQIHAPNCRGWKPETVFHLEKRTTTSVCG